MTELNLEMRDPASLTPYIKNAKKHPEAQVERLAKVIQAFGFDQPIVVDKAGVIIKGHGRREAALLLGLAEVPVIVSDLDEYQAMASRIADNKVVSEDYDSLLLQAELKDIAATGFDMSLTGMPEGVLEVYLQDDAAPTGVKQGGVLKGGLAKLPDATPMFCVFGEYRLPITQEELDGVHHAIDLYTDQYGTRFGFVKHLCQSRMSETVEGEDSTSE